MPLNTTTAKAVIYSVLLHSGLFGLMAININSKPKIFSPPPKPNMDIVEAVTINNQDVEKELNRLKEIDNEKARKQQEAEKKLKTLEKKLADAEDQRRQEEKKLADAKKKQQQERIKREAEEKRIAQLQEEKDRLAKEARLEEEKKLKAEQEKRKAEEDRRRAEEEHKRLIAEQKKKEEEERLRKEQEKALQEQLAQEQKMLEEAQAKQDQQLLRNIVSNIYNRVVTNFNKTGLPAGLECVFTVRVLPGGEIIHVQMAQSSGNDIFDDRALTAIQKASPLPMPEDAATLDRLNLRNFNFRFKPQ